MSVSVCAFLHAYLLYITALLNLTWCFKCTSSEAAFFQLLSQMCSVLYTFLDSHSFLLTKAWWLFTRSTFVCPCTASRSISSYFFSYYTKRVVDIPCIYSCMHLIQRHTSPFSSSSSIPHSPKSNLSLQKNNHYFVLHTCITYKTGINNMQRRKKSTYFFLHFPLQH